MSAKHSRVQKADAEWAAKVKDRDGWCRLPSIPAYINEDGELMPGHLFHEGPADAHHVLGKKAHPRLRYDEANGVRACRKGHNWIHANPALFKAWFAMTEPERWMGLCAKAQRENRLNEGGD